jgi:hypothetical protein
MNFIKKTSAASFISILALSIFLAAMSTITPMASAAAPSITLTPSQGASSTSVNVTGTGFVANSAVGIGFGAEVPVIGEQVDVTQTRPANYDNRANLARTPIKPGTFSMTANPLYLGFTITDYAGTITAQSMYFFSGTLNYVTGALTYSTSTTDMLAGQTTESDRASYTTYANNVSPAAGINTNAQGSFATAITIPNVSNGTYAVTAIDPQGNLATSTFTVGTSVVPEFPTPWMILPLLAVATLLSIVFIRENLPKK